MSDAPTPVDTAAGTASATLTPSPAIEAIDVRKTFDKGVVTALDGLTMRVDPGEYVAITGRSGCGKSTLMHLIAALDHPDSGTLRVNGTDITRPTHVNRYRRHEVGLVFQLHNLLPHLEAAHNVELAMFGTSRNARARAERAAELLGRMGLADVASRSPSKLSGGERLRVAIARALANDPPLLLADEPTGSLDQQSMEMVLSLFGELRRNRGLTVVMVTHDPRAVSQADRQLVLADGRLTPVS